MQQEGRAVRPGSVHERLWGATANILLCVLPRDQLSCPALCAFRAGQPALGNVAQIEPITFLLRRKHSLSGFFLLFV